MIAAQSPHGNRGPAPSSAAHAPGGAPPGNGSATGGGNAPRHAACAAMKCSACPDAAVTLGCGGKPLCAACAENREPCAACGRPGPYEWREPWDDLAEKNADADRAERAA